MPGSHQAAVTILCAHMAFWVHGLESDTVRYITVVKGVEMCPTVWEIGHNIIHDVSILIKQIKSRPFFAHRQKCSDISSMPTVAWCELAITYLKALLLVLKIGLKNKLALAMSDVKYICTILYKKSGYRKVIGLLPSFFKIW